MLSLLKFGLTAFVTLLVVVDPFGVVPIFSSLTSGLEKSRRRAVLSRAVGVAFVVAIFFLIAGRAALAYLGVTVNAFGISGGILLFMTALPMLFGHRGGLQGAERSEDEAAGEDISLFPLAIPLLSGPGAMTSILLLTTEARGDLARLIALIVSIGVVYGCTWIVLRLGDSLLSRIGTGGVHVVTRVMGIVLAALAVQFVLNGIAGYYALLHR